MCSRASESSVTLHCIGRCRASESPVTFHCTGRFSLPPFQLPRASESSVTFHCIGRSVTFRRVHTPQVLSSHTIRIREESYRFFTNVCMNVCIFLYMYVFMHASMHVCSHAHTYSM